MHKTPVTTKSQSFQLSQTPTDFKTPATAKSQSLQLSQSPDNFKENSLIKLSLPLKSPRMTQELVVKC